MTNPLSKAIMYDDGKRHKGRHRAHRRAFEGTRREVRKLRSLRQRGEKIGKVDDLFIDENDREEHIGVKMGLFGLSVKTLIPREIAHVDEQQRRIEVAASKDQVKNAPHYNDDDDIEDARHVVARVSLP